MKIETTNLLTIRSYAEKQGVTTTYIYKLIKQGDLEVVKIDGVQFIDKNKFPNLK